MDTFFPVSTGYTGNMEVTSRDAARLRRLVEMHGEDLQRYGVVALLLFGSALGRGRRWRGSDLDVAILLSDDAGEGAASRVYSMIQREVRSDVDLVVLNDAPRG